MFRHPKRKYSMGKAIITIGEASIPLRGTVEWESDNLGGTNSNIVHLFT